MPRNDDPFAAFGALISAMGGGGDAGNAFPQSDADDLRSGAEWIPGEVTIARRRGEAVMFVQTSMPRYWLFQDGSKVTMDGDRIPGTPETRAMYAQIAPKQSSSKEGWPCDGWYHNDMFGNPRKGGRNRRAG